MKTEEINCLLLLLHLFFLTSILRFSPSQSLETALKYCNYFFTSTFVIEASLKLVAFGFRRFFKDRYKRDTQLCVDEFYEPTF